MLSTADPICQSQNDVQCVSPDFGVLVSKIHGSKDRTLPLRHNRPDVVVNGAGHLLPFARPEPVDESIGRRLIDHG